MKILNGTKNEIIKKISIIVFDIFLLLFILLGITIPIMTKQDIENYIPDGYYTASTNMSNLGSINIGSMSNYDNYVKKLTDKQKDSKEFKDLESLRNCVLEYAKKFENIKVSDTSFKSDLYKDLIYYKYNECARKLFESPSQIHSNPYLSRFASSLIDTNLNINYNDAYASYEKVIINNDYNLYFKYKLNEMENEITTLNKTLEENTKNLNEETDEDKIEILRDTISSNEERLEITKYLRDLYNDLVNSENNIDIEYVINYINEIESYIPFVNEKIVSEEEYNKDEDLNNTYLNYKNYVSVTKKKKENFKESVEILKYASINKINYDKRGSRTAFNDLLTYLPFVAIFMIAITGGIISKEFSTGTIRLLITKPMKRWKIYTSKYITVMFFLLIVSLFLIVSTTISTSFVFKLTDLKIPYLLYKGGKVIETSYYLFFLKRYIVMLLPIIFYITLSFVISTVFLNSSFSITISILSLLLSELIVAILNRISSLLVKFTPFIYTLYDYLGNKESMIYVEEAFGVPITVTSEILVCIVFTIIFYLIGLVIFCKRDIKN